jgi:hypothetical protein
LRNKFDNLQSKKTVATQRESRIKKTILQLQKSGPLLPEAVSLLELGPKIALTPQEVPKMDIITEVEKCCLTLEKQDKENKADELRHQVTLALLKVPKPISNLTSKQKVGLSFLKKNKDLAVTPFYKGLAL